MILKYNYNNNNNNNNKTKWDILTSYLFHL